MPHFGHFMDSSLLMTAFIPELTPEVVCAQHHVPDIGYGRGGFID
jgi:hypothetical protein